MAGTVYLSGFADLGVIRLYPTNMSWNEQNDMIDVSDLSTILGESDFEIDKQKMNFTVEGWLEIHQALPVRGTEITIDLDFEGYLIAGDGRISTVNIDAVFDTAMRVTLTGTFVGIVTITEVAI